MRLVGRHGRKAADLGCWPAMSACTSTPDISAASTRVAFRSNHAATGSTGLPRKRAGPEMSAVRPSELLDYQDCPLTARKAGWPAVNHCSRAHAGECDRAGGSADGAALFRRRQSFGGALQRPRRARPSRSAAACPTPGRMPSHGCSPPNSPRPASRSMPRRSRRPSPCTCSSHMGGAAAPSGSRRAASSARRGGASPGGRACAGEPRW